MVAPIRECSVGCFNFVEMTVRGNEKSCRPMKKMKRQKRVMRIIGQHWFERGVGTKITIGKSIQMKAKMKKKNQELEKG